MHELAEGQATAREVPNTGDSICWGTRWWVGGCFREGMGHIWNLTIGLMCLLFFFSTVFSSNKSKVSSLPVQAYSPMKSCCPWLKVFVMLTRHAVPAILTLHKNWQGQLKTNTLRNKQPTAKKPTTNLKSKKQMIDWRTLGWGNFFPLEEGVTELPGYQSERRKLWVSGLC